MTFITTDHEWYCEQIRENISNITHITNISTDKLEKINKRALGLDEFNRDVLKAITDCNLKDIDKS
mgnify:CR=1 FL=1